jgi:hypothetical protein
VRGDEVGKGERAGRREEGRKGCREWVVWWGVAHVTLAEWMTRRRKAMRRGRRQGRAAWKQEYRGRERGVKRKTETGLKHFP